jgi:hypothetical protein
VPWVPKLIRIMPITDDEDEDKVKSMEFFFPKGQVSVAVS